MTTPVVAKASLVQVVEAIADALAPVAIEIPGLQIYPFLNVNPTPPSIDIYPGDPFLNGSGFTPYDADLFFTVRARTTTADSEAAQRQLLRLLDLTDAASVAQALTGDLGGVVQSAGVADDGTSGYREYLEDPQSNGHLIGCEWRLWVIW